MKIKINVPTDNKWYLDMAVDELYGGDMGAVELDHGQLLFDHLGDISRLAGLVVVEPTDWGCIWAGTPQAIEKAKIDLPKWADVEEI